MTWNFSSEYYLCQLDIRYVRSDRPQLDHQEFDDITDMVGGNEPLIVKIETAYLPIYRGAAIPADTLALPMIDASENNIDNIDDQDVMVPKDQDQAKSLLWPDR